MTRLRWTLIGCIALLVAMGGILYLDRSTPVAPAVRVEKLTDKEAQAVHKLRPGKGWTLRTETGRACWTVNSSRMEICYRR